MPGWALGLCCSMWKAYNTILIEKWRFLSSIYHCIRATFNLSLWISSVYLFHTHFPLTYDYFVLMYSEWDCCCLGISRKLIFSSLSLRRWDFWFSSCLHWPQLMSVIRGEPVTAADILICVLSRAVLAAKMVEDSCFSWGPWDSTFVFKDLCSLHWRPRSYSVFLFTHKGRQLYKWNLSLNHRVL